jgi:hypothetical protein
MARRFEGSRDDRPADADAASERREPEQDGLSEDELGLQHAEAIPDRAALSTINADVMIPLDPSVAADVLAGLGDEDADALDESGEAPDEGRDPGPDEG